MLIQIASIHQLSMWFRQTPDDDGDWNGVRYTFDAAGDCTDFLVVYDEAPAGFTTRLPRSRRILFLSEPQTIKRYPQPYLDCFGTVVSISDQPGYLGNLIRHNPALPWLYGLDINNPDGPQNFLRWNALERAETAAHPTRGELSVVCSTKTMNLNQARRLRFLEMLKRRLGDQLAIFGRGFNPIEDKAEGLDGFRYHLVLENNLLEHGWTEKLADPILAGCFPIVSGGDNLGMYFNPGGFRTINTRRPREAVETVLAILKEDPKRQAADFMQHNKQRLMHEHNFFAVCSRIALGQSNGAHTGATDKGLLDKPAAIPRPVRSRMDKLLSLPKPLRKPLRWLYLNLAERA